MNEDKKKKAAIAAVMQYLQEESQQLQAAGPKRFPVAIPDRSMLSVVRPWGLSGRDAQMQIRSMMQLKVFRG